MDREDIEGAMRVSPPYRHLVRMLVVAAAIIAGSWVTRGRADVPDGRYGMTSATVTDMRTKLVWERNISETTVAWQAASDHCASLDIDGAKWRLPSMKELQTIVDRSGVTPTIDPNAFSATPAKPFWTSSSRLTTMDAWTVDFSNGYTAYSNVDSATGLVRCVRP